MNRFTYRSILSLFLIPILLAFTPFDSRAADRKEKIRTLIEAQGMLRTIEEQMQAGRKEARAQADQMMKQVMTGLQPPPQFTARFNDASEKFIASMLASPWSPQEITDLWAEIYGAKFTDGELDKLIAFYTSPLGQKEVEVSRTSLTPFTEKLQARTRPLVQRAVQEYVERLKVITQECRCQKTASK